MITVVGCDVETTGFHQEKGDRITEIALDIYLFNGKTFTRKGMYHTLVNPQRSIPEKVQRITGILPSMVTSAPTWEEIAPKVARILNVADVFVAHNVMFDAPFVAMELVRAGQSVNPKMQTFCTMQNGRFATPLGKVPKLTELCWALDVDFDDTTAHRADYDTKKMMECLIVGVENNNFTLPEVFKNRAAA